MSNLVKLETLVKRVKVGFVGSIDNYYCDEKNGYLLIRTLNLGENSIDYSDVKYVTKEFYIKNGKSQLHKGDILIARHGDNGKSCIYDRDVPAQALNVVIIEPDETQFSSYMIKLFIESPYVKKQINGGVRGSVQGVINTKQIADLNIPIDETIQYPKIESLLKSVDRKIENNTKINAELESMAKTIYDYWFLQFEFPNEEGKPYKSSGGVIVWNDELQREIPEGWNVQTVFECADTAYGWPLSTELFGDSGTPVVRIRDILNNSISTYTSEEIEERYLAKNRDLLIGMDGNFHMNFWATDGDCINQRIFRIRDKKIVSPLQIYFEIKPYIKAKESNVACSTVGHLSDKDLKELRILVPDKEYIYDYFNDILSKICNNKKENQELASLRGFLLPLLMNGQITFKK